MQRLAEGVLTQIAWLLNINCAGVLVLRDGKVRSLVPDGFNWPLDLAMGDDGVLFVADGPYCYTLRPGESLAGPF